MADESGQEKTEQPSEKRLREAKEKGQVVRSKDLAVMVMTLGTTLIFMGYGKKLANDMLMIFSQGLSFEYDFLQNEKNITGQLHAQTVFAFQSIVPILIIFMVLGVAGTALLGGVIFSAENISIKLERLDPIKGLKKIFSIRIVVETIKSILKFCLLFVVYVIFFKSNLYDIFRYDFLPLKTGVYDSMQLMIMTLLWLSLSLVVVVSIDIPFQIWSYMKQMKMTKQELREESKDLEGKPEVKGKMRQLQREMRRRRMMGEVPKADVVITNPTHYAVAIKYDEHAGGAPILVAKGVDLISEMIKKVALANSVPIVSAPAVARSLYYNVELEEEIPSELYVAVAKILAYVYELKLYKKGKANKPVLPKEYEIPEEYVR